jgi:radical SAM protein
MPFRFDTAPRRIYWELTRACDLACTHCRASATSCLDPRELTTSEIFRVIEEIAAVCAPSVIYTGGDPLKRRDFFDIVAHTVAMGLPCLVAPSATPLLTRDVVASLASLHVSGMSLSLDGSTASRHDAVRGVAGTFEHTGQITRVVVEAGIPLQINTLVTADTVDDLPAIHRIVRAAGARRWSLFFLIRTGRARGLRQITPAQAEAVMNWALDLPKGRPAVTTTEAPHYRRVQLMRCSKNADHGECQPASVRGLGIRDGNGVMFISHVGQIQPSGFLPLTAGNARTDNPIRVYRESQLFKDLRRPALFSGRCGRCEFRDVCGGSRARTYAATGDPFGSDPLCSYVPPAPVDGRAWAPN